MHWQAPESFNGNATGHPNAHNANHIAGVNGQVSQFNAYQQQQLQGMHTVPDQQQQQQQGNAMLPGPYHHGQCQSQDHYQNGGIHNGIGMLNAMATNIAQPTMSLATAAGMGEGREAAMPLHSAMGMSTTTATQQRQVS